MIDRPQDGGGPLAGERVAFTGRLACLARGEAADLVGRYGGECVAAVNRRTTLLVVGQDGWPLRPDGRVTSKLETARRLQRAGCPLAVISEEELLARVGLVHRSQAVFRRYTAAQLTQLLGIRGDRVRAWMSRGLIEPAETTDGVPFFDFHQVSGARVLCRLEQAGVSLTRIRQSLEQMRGWLPRLDKPLAHLAVLEQSKRVLVRLENGSLAEPGGQLWFDFGEPDKETAGAVEVASPSGAECFELGCSLEAAGRLREAAAAYRAALRLGRPDADTCFNLANALYRLGEPAQAVERFQQAVELDPCHAAAWNNLGNALADVGEPAQAVTAYRHALRADPHYAEAHYNLADTLADQGRQDEANAHWKAYLRQDQASRWAEYARQALAASGG
jgi:tetratricopeptide (TPR) repeat protein